MARENDRADQVQAPGNEATFVAAVAEALADLKRRIPDGLSPLEQAEEARLREALRRFGECAEQLAEADLVVPGSTGQLRPHPLVAVERDLRREISEGLRELIFRADNRAAVVRMNKLSRRRRAEAEESS
jgi:hypothetical protein